MGDGGGDGSEKRPDVPSPAASAPVTPASRPRAWWALGAGGAAVLGAALLHGQRSPAPRESTPTAALAGAKLTTLPGAEVPVAPPRVADHAADNGPPSSGDPLLEPASDR